LIVALAGGACGDAGADERGVEAVVLITCDTLRADRLGFYGHPGGTSPNLDGLAREALVFESAWATAPMTGPALSALMTGRMPAEYGLIGNQTHLASAATTLAERLSEAGIETAAVVSNWVIRRRPELPDAGLAQGFAHYDDHMTVPEKSRPNLMERTAPDTTDAALAWLDGRSRDGPFFLWVHYQDPHGPYTPPEDCLVSPAPPSDGERVLEKGATNTGLESLPRYQVVDDERRASVYRARYEAEIRFFDREVGRLIESLRARGLLERALLVFSADHGESLGEHGFYFSHGQNLHRELVQVPLLVRPPGGAEVPGRRRGPASHLDLFPTVLSAFGLAPGESRGLDLLAGELPPERVVGQALRDGWSVTGARHRLVVEKGRRLLFDLERDPGEEHDLAPSQPELARELVERHQAYARQVEAILLRPEKPALDEQERKALDDLGYGGDDDH
jgi:arylsulfatase